MMPIKTYKKIKTILLYFVMKKKSWNKLPKRARTWDYILNRGYNCATVRSVTRKILACNMECFYKNILKIHNVTFIFQIFLKIPMNSKKSKDSFKVRKNSHLIIYATIISFSNFFITFPFLLCKIYMFLTSSI